MPYIVQEKRDILDPAIDEVIQKLVELETDDENNNMEGNINYVITKILRRVYGPTGYSNVNDAMGMILSCALEHYITVARPYEAQKCFENGDVDFDAPGEMVSEVVVKEDK